MVNIHGTSHDDILDSFLTTIESKLRGPFSSLDLAKAVSTTALRSTQKDNEDPAKEYLTNLSSVFGRTNKVIQCRMLIGLLGLNDMRKTKDDHQYLTPEILRILHETQEGSLHEDWVRTTSGLIEGVMFQTRNKNNNTRESCRSKEATNIIQETGTEVCETVEGQIRTVGKPYGASEDKKPQQEQTPNAPTSAATANKRNRGFAIEKVIPSTAIKKEAKPPKKEHNTVVPAAIEPTPPDLNACFAPYRYSLISTPVLNTIIPEFNHGNWVSDANCHFKVNSSARILQIDLDLETQRAKEHGSGVATKAGSSTNANKANKDPKAAVAGKTTFTPAYRPAKLVPTTTSKVGAMKAAAGKSSLFMPKKKPAANLFNTTTKFRPQPSRTMLKRKGGGAQALLKTTVGGGGAILNKLGGGSSTATSSATTQRFSGASRGTKVSRMKMIDDDDVDTLTKLQWSTAASNMTAAELRASKRKRIMEQARGTFGSNNKKAKVAAPAAPQAAPAAAPQPLESWQILLRDRSNKLEDADRQRIQQFFTTTNPSERLALVGNSNEPTWRKKLHEQRGRDAETGQEIKETFYITLDYTTGASEQTKKVKKY